jgi:hypothetical protein
VVIAIIALLIGISLPAVHRVRDLGIRIQCMNRVRQIGVALQQHHDEHRVLPAGCGGTVGKVKTPFMGWGTRLLPYLGEVPLWEQAVAAFSAEPNFMRPPHVGGRAMSAFLCASDDREVRTFNANRRDAGYTFFLGVEGTDQDRKDGMLFFESKVSFSQGTDGLSHTLLVGERPPSRLLSYSLSAPPTCRKPVENGRPDGPLRNTSTGC